MKRTEENISVIEHSFPFYKPDQVTGYKVLIDLTSLVIIIKTKIHFHQTETSLYDCGYHV